MPKLITISIGTKNIEQRLTKHYASIARARLAVDDQRDIILGDITRVLGGATCMTVRGAYQMNDGTVVTEDTYQFTGVSLMDADDDHVAQLTKLACIWKGTFGEEAVLLTVQALESAVLL